MSHHMTATARPGLGGGGMFDGEPDDRRLPERCSGCAFTAGTEANLQPLTLLKATLCVRVLAPFYCHANAIDGKLPDDDRRLCVGYVEAMDVLHKRRYYDRQPKRVAAHLRKHLRRVIRLEDRFLTGEDVGVPPASVAALAHDMARDQEARS